MAYYRVWNTEGGYEYEFIRGDIRNKLTGAQLMHFEIFDYSYSKTDDSIFIGEKETHHNKEVYAIIHYLKSEKLKKYIKKLA